MPSIADRLVGSGLSSSLPDWSIGLTHDRWPSSGGAFCFFLPMLERVCGGCRLQCTPPENVPAAPESRRAVFCRWGRHVARELTAAGQGQEVATGGTRNLDSSRRKKAVEGC
jgi:hypothetical protein